MLRVFSAIVALLVVAAFAAPLASALTVCCPETTCEASESGCDAAAGGCPQCAAFGKILAQAEWDGVCVRRELPMKRVAAVLFLPEGHMPEIDQPPRTA